MNQTIAVTVHELRWLKVVGAYYTILEQVSCILVLQILAPYVHNPFSTPAKGRDSIKNRTVGQPSKFSQPEPRR